MSFINKDYEIPQAPSKYMRFEEGKGEAGKNIFRILGSFEDGTAIMGYEFWKTVIDENGKSTRKPVRRKMDESIFPDELEINDKTGEIEMAKHFWAVPVYNYKANCIQILELTQTSQRLRHYCLQGRFSTRDSMLFSGSRSERKAE
jgi:hypothetical protein